MDGQSPVSLLADKKKKKRPKQKLYLLKNKTKQKLSPQYNIEEKAL